MRDRSPIPIQATRARADGTLFALDLDGGHVDWHFSASNDIYASPAVADVAGTSPTVFIGS